MVQTESSNRAPAATQATSAVHFAQQSLSDGDLDRLIQTLTTGSPQKPTAEQFEFARAFLREIGTILADPVKLAADETVSAVIGLIVEKAIKQVRGKKSASGRDSGDDQSKSPIVLIFRNSLTRVSESFQTARPSWGAVAVSLNTDELVVHSGFTREQVEAILTLAHFRRDGIRWMPPAAISGLGQRYGRPIGRALDIKYMILPKKPSE
jgi:hypothetical protein